MLTQFVKLVPYNPEWKNMFEVDKQLIHHAFQGKVVQIEHIGSTSVPEMWAKPIIDIAAAVVSFSILDKETIERLAAIGYEYVPKEEFPNRRFFRRGEWGAGTHHLHIYEHGSEEWENIIMFRDYLRKHKDAAEEYIKLKKQLARQHDRQMYTVLKGPFIQAILNNARKEMQKS
jgi:GrpB-like predicted nucleotidyltransferase (UPF0157 family)